jgi:hypothetical protein
MLSPKNALDIFLILKLHISASFCASAAGFSTFAAMFVFVISAFFCTGFADIGAYFTNFHGFIAAEAHELRGGVANSGTFHI